MIGTDRGRVKDAIRFKIANGDSTWAVIGKSSAWPNEAAPPTPDETLTALDEPILAVKASVFLVVEDDVNGSFEFNDINGNIIKYRAFATNADAITAGSTLVLLRANTLGGNIDVAAFREVGFVTDLIPATGFESETLLTPDQVANWGDLETVDFKIKRTIDPTVVYEVAGIIQY